MTVTNDIPILGRRMYLWEERVMLRKKFRKRLVTLDQWEDSPAQALLRGLTLLLQKRCQDGNEVVLVLYPG